MNNSGEGTNPENFSKKNKLPRRAALRLLSRRAVKLGLASPCLHGQNITAINSALYALRAQIEKEIEPMRETERRIHSIFARCPKDKMTGQERKLQQTKYGYGGGFAVHTGGTDAGCDMDDTTAALVRATGHAHTDEAIGSPLA